jgi:hypothetical protein
MKCPYCDCESPDIARECVNCGAGFIKNEEELELEKAAMEKVAREKAEKEKLDYESKPTPPPAPPVYQAPPVSQVYYAPPQYQAPVYQVPSPPPPVYQTPPVQQVYQTPVVQQAPYVQPMYSQPYQPAPINPGSSLGVASLILGIFAIVFCGITAIPGLITGIIGLSKSKDANMKNNEAIGGICCSIFSVVMTIFGIIISLLAELM